MQTLGQSDNVFVKMSFCAKKNWNFGRNVDFFIKCALLLKAIIFLQNSLFLEKCDILCEGLYTLRKCQILIKNYNFLGYVNCLCVNFH